MSLAKSEWGEEQYKWSEQAVTRLPKTELSITFNTSVLDGPNMFFPQNMTLTSASLVNSNPWILHWLNWFLGFSIGLPPNYYHSSSHVFPSSKNRPLKLSHFLIFTAITLVLVSVTSCLKYSIKLLAVLLVSILISFPIHSSTCGQRDHSKRLFRSHDSKWLLILGIKCLIMLYILSQYI